MTDGSIPYPATIAGKSFGRWLNDAVKRGFEVTAVIMALFFLWPFFLLVAYLVRRDSPGPVFYRGPRAGRYGRIFHILKFRTMYERPASYAGPKVTAQDDPRITPIGHFLRHTKLNELPQLWNVLVGDMSLVGPRPEDPEIAAGWPEDVRREVLSVRPGITSPASVVYRNEEALLQTDQVMLTYLESVLPSKLRLDQLYVRNSSILLDLDIIFWTLMLLVLRMSSYTPPEKMLFIGPVTRLVRRHVSWLVIDAVITFIALLLTGIFWPGFNPFAHGLVFALAVPLVFATLFGLSGALFGVERVAWNVASSSDAFDLLFSAALAFGMAHIVNRLAAPAPVLPPGMILFATVFAFIGFVAVRFRSRLIRAIAYHWGSRQVARERVLIIGGGAAGRFAALLLRSFRGPGFLRVVGYVDDDPYKQDLRIQGVEVLGHHDDIPRLVQQHDVGVLVFAQNDIPPANRQRLLQLCRSTKAHVVLIPDLLGALNAAVMLDLDGEQPLAKATRGNLAEASQAWSQIPSSQVNRWLDEIAGLAEGGDLAAVQGYLYSLRQKMQASYAELIRTSEND